MKSDISKTESKNGIFHEIFYVGFKEAVKSSLGIFKIMLPVSLLMAILNYFGIVDWLSVIFQPITNLLGLSGKAILPLLSGYLINTYSAIALMISLELPMKEIAILSSMILLSHTLPVELSIQKKAGGNMGLLFLIRVGSSIITGIVLNIVLPNESVIISSETQAITAVATTSLLVVLKSWVQDNVTTIIKIFVINIVISVVFKCLIKFHVVDKLSSLLKPIMFIFGLGKECAPYWLIANVIGLIYGAGILITANENKDLGKEEIRRLNVSICSMHSIIQETANFLVLGVSILVLIVPRFITAVVSVWVYNFVGIVWKREKFNK
jgi:hypothetical protein